MLQARHRAMLGAFALLGALFCSSAGASDIISPRAHRNVNGLPYASPVNYTHSSDLPTMQEIFRVGPFLGDAANATDLSDLFEPGAVPRTEHGFSTARAK